MAKILKSPPLRQAKFPPPAAGRKHQVKTGDNWWSLATKYGRADPWDIIEFNFRTRNAREVNWYMETYLGCRFSASDGVNYRFDSSDHPGILYIPPASWTPSEDLALRHMVAFTLASPVIARLNVQFAGHSFVGRSFATVANRVLDGEIGVVVDSALKGWEAEYDSPDDTLHLGFRRASSRSRKGLIVHEMAHAVLDLKAVEGLTVAQSESFAYVVQCYYVREYALDPDAERLTDPNPFKDRVYELAWSMAATLSKRKQPSAIEWLALEHAVHRHPTYKKSAGKPAVFDGI